VTREQRTAAVEVKRRVPDGAALYDVLIWPKGVAMGGADCTMGIHTPEEEAAAEEEAPAPEEEAEEATATTTPEAAEAEGEAEEEEEEEAEEAPAPEEEKAEKAAADLYGLRRHSGFRHYSGLRHYSALRRKPEPCNPPLSKGCSHADLSIARSGLRLIAKSPRWGQPTPRWRIRERWFSTRCFLLSHRLEIGNDPGMPAQDYGFRRTASRAIRLPGERDAGAGVKQRKAVD
jgi:hypothetical protein